ncbi:MAG: hypothetical protein U5K36_03910 [Roseovarius sp.]|nr:hypothetical protein [Roseovarius sp.]
MLALMRLLIFGGIALGTLYLGLSWYLRSAHRARMEKDWEAAGRPGNRAAYIEEGMAQYERSLRRRLLWLVFILPVAAVMLLIWLTNFN